MVLEGNILQLPQLHAGRAFDLDDVYGLPLNSDDIRRAGQSIGGERRLADDFSAIVDELSRFFCHFPCPPERDRNSIREIGPCQRTDFVAFRRADILLFFEDIRVVHCQP